MVAISWELTATAHQYQDSWHSFPWADPHVISRSGISLDTCGLVARKNGIDYARCGSKISRSEQKVKEKWPMISVQSVMLFGFLQIMGSEKV